MEELSVVSPVDEGMDLYPDAPAEFIGAAQTEEPENVEDVKK